MDVLCTFAFTLEFTATNEELVVSSPLETAAGGNVNVAEEDFATEDTDSNVDTLSLFHF